MCVSKYIVYQVIESSWTCTGRFRNPTGRIGRPSPLWIPVGGLCTERERSRLPGVGWLRAVVAPRLLPPVH